MESQTHYHSTTETFFKLGECDWCRGPVHELNDSVVFSGFEKDCLQWGEKELPAKPEEGFCEACKGVTHYVDTIKGEYAIIKRPNGEVVDTRKSKKTANKLCKELNKKQGDSVDGTVVLDRKQELTNEPEDIKLGNSIIIRLTSTLNDTYTRGVHVEIPIEELLTLIKKNGAKPMTKTSDRKTAKDLIRSLIIKKKTDDQILGEVEKQFPDSNADKKHCTKYRRELFVEKEIEADLAAVGSREHQIWAKANKAAAKRGPHKDHWKDQEVKDKERIAAKKAADKGKKKSKASLDEYRKGGKNEDVLA